MCNNEILTMNPPTTPNTPPTPKSQTPPQPQRSNSLTNLIPSISSPNTKPITPKTPKLTKPTPKSNQKSKDLKKLYFGKHAGKTYKYVYDNETDYCLWALSVSNPKGSLIDFVEYLKVKFIDDGYGYEDMRGTGILDDDQSDYDTEDIRFSYRESDSEDQDTGCITNTSTLSKDDVQKLVEVANAVMGPVNVSEHTTEITWDEYYKWKNLKDNKNNDDTKSDVTIEISETTIDIDDEYDLKRKRDDDEDDESRKKRIVDEVDLTGNITDSDSEISEVVIM